jgi:NitT/TauT family transport system ATP-binding protein/sulfonate transport system ATP-binding protein
MTPRPGRIEEVLDVTLPRPRSRGDRGFLELRTLILEKLHFVSRKKEPEYFL